MVDGAIFDALTGKGPIEDMIKKLNELIEIQKETLELHKASYTDMHRELREIKIRTQEMGH